MGRASAQTPPETGRITLTSGDAVVPDSGPLLPQAFGKQLALVCS
jgi:hypothetical protein